MEETLTNETAILQSTTDATVTPPPPPTTTPPTTTTIVTNSKIEVEDEDDADYADDAASEEENIKNQDQNNNNDSNNNNADEFTTVAGFGDDDDHSASKIKKRKNGSTDGDDAADIIDDDDELMDEFGSVKKDSGVLDAFGFNVPSHCVEMFRKQTEVQAARREATRSQWKLLLSELSDRPKEIRKLLRSAVVSGVPGEYRPTLWPLLCGVPTYQAQMPGLFNKLITKAEKMDPHSQIILDLDRTFPGHPLLETQDGMDALQRVLTAYALYDQEVGYCQSTNFMVGLMLIMDVKEEEAFWMLVHISRVLLPEYFAPPMLGTSVDHAVFRDLLETYMPRVVVKLDELRLDVAILCAQWFLCIFCNRMPCETVCRIWDVVLCRGPPAMFQTALAIIKLQEEKLLAVEDMGEVMEIMREAEISMFDADHLLETAFCEYADVVEVTTMRQAKRPIVLQQYKEWRDKVRPSAAAQASALADEFRQSATKAIDHAADAISSRLKEMKFDFDTMRVPTFAPKQK